MSFIINTEIDSINNWQILQKTWKELGIDKVSSR
jgi:hypothetical protein